MPEEPLEDLGADAGAVTGDPAVPGGDAGSSAEPSASPPPGEPEDLELPSATIVNIEDGTSMSILNPGVTHRVALIWEQSGTWSGTELPLEVVELEWVEEDPLGLDDGHWFANEVAFQGQIPVKPARQADDDEGASTEAEHR